MREKKNTAGLRTAMIEMIEKKAEGKIDFDKKNFDSLNISFLSLIYLENDLESAGHGNSDKLENFLFIPYPDYIIWKEKKRPRGKLTELSNIKDLASTP